MGVGGESIMHFAMVFCRCLNHGRQHAPLPTPPSRRRRFTRGGVVCVRACYTSNYIMGQATSFSGQCVCADCSSAPLDRRHVLLVDTHNLSKSQIENIVPAVSVAILDVGATKTSWRALVEQEEFIWQTVLCSGRPRRRAAGGATCFTAMAIRKGIHVCFDESSLCLPSHLLGPENYLLEPEGPSGPSGLLQRSAVL